MGLPLTLPRHAGGNGAYVAPRCRGAAAAGDEAKGCSEEPGAELDVRNWRHLLNLGVNPMESIMETPPDGSGALSLVRR